MFAPFTLNEDFLHFIWRQKLWQFVDAKTTDGEPIVVQKTGIWNNMDGPDFLNAQIMIGDRIWNGHVEIHVKTSDWFAHNHQHDKKYNPVILHVVYENDKSGSLNIPTVELKGKIKRHYLNNYVQLMENQTWLACGGALKTFDQQKLQMWLQRMLVERTEYKQASLTQLTKNKSNHWEEVLFMRVMRAFGYHYNSNAMEELALRLPFKEILKETSPDKIKALLTLAAGFKLEESSIGANHILIKYNVEQMEEHNWVKRVRPAVRPPKVFNAVAELYATEQSVFNSVKESFQVFVNEFKLPFRTYNYLSKAQETHVWLNAFVPVLLLYARENGNDLWQEKLWDLLTHLSPDKNKIIERFKQEGVKVPSAAESQALLHMHKHFCTLKKCLSCPIGISSIKQNQHD